MAPKLIDLEFILQFQKIDIKPLEINEVDSNILNDLISKLGSFHHLDGPVSSSLPPIVLFRLPKKNLKRNLEAKQFTFLPWVWPTELGSCLTITVFFKNKKHHTRTYINKNDPAFKNFEAGEFIAIFVFEKKPVAAFKVNCIPNQTLKKTYTDMIDTVKAWKAEAENEDLHYWEVLEAQTTFKNRFNKRDKEEIRKTKNWRIENNISSINQSRSIPPHVKRKIEISRFTPPPSGTKERAEFEQWTSHFKEDPKFKKYVKKMWTKTKALVTASYENGAGFAMDIFIREYCLEFNGRLAQFGPGKMPSSYNVFEAFLEYDPKLVMFKIREERDFLVNFQDFFEFVTDPDQHVNLEDSINLIEEGVIYSFNASNNLEDITFSTQGQKEFCVGGFSFIRHKNEISFGFLCGENANVDQETRQVKKKWEEFKPIYGREEIKPSKEYELEAVPLLGNKSFWKTNVLLRIDINDKSQECKYVYKDEGQSYSILTDDISCYLNSKGEFLNLSLQEVFKNQVQEIKTYNILFELCSTALFLPLYFEKNEEFISEERHETKLFKNSKTKTGRARNNLLTSHERINFRRVSIIQKEATSSSRFTTYLAPEFKQQVTGFWKNLPPGSVGADRQGKPIHGRTWVNKSISWLESNPNLQPITATSKTTKTNKDSNSVGKNEGYIYILQSAAHQSDTFKVGRTTRTPEARANELSRETGSPSRFLVLKEWDVLDCVEAEELIHQKLAQYRVNPKREFFQAPYKVIFAVVEEVVSHINSGREH